MRKLLYIAALARRVQRQRRPPTKQAPRSGRRRIRGRRRTSSRRDVKDPDLAQLIELAQNGPGTTSSRRPMRTSTLERDDITLAADGTVTHHHKSIAKLLDAQRGKEKFADVHVPFDQKRQTLEDRRRAHGQRRRRAARGLARGDRRHRAGVPRRRDDLLGRARARRVVPRRRQGLGRRARVHAHDEADARLGDRRRGDARRSGIRSTSASVTITVPKGVAAQARGRRRRAASRQKSTSGDGDVYTYTLKDLPDRHPESESPPDAAVLPRLVYGFQPSWAKVIEPVADRVPRRRGAGDAGRGRQGGGRSRRRRCEDREREADEAVRVRRARHPHASTCRSAGAGYEPHAPELVLQNKYADQRDKVGLLLAMARRRGHRRSARCSCAPAQVPVIASVPTIAQFDRMVAKLTVDGKEVWLDPDDEHGQFGVVARWPGQPRAAAREGRRRARPAPGARSVDVGRASSRSSTCSSANGDLDDGATRTS